MATALLVLSVLGIVALVDGRVDEGDHLLRVVRSAGP
jgi:hypothetical protein